MMKLLPAVLALASCGDLMLTPSTKDTVLIGNGGYAVKTRVTTSPRNVWWGALSQAFHWGDPNVLALPVDGLPNGTAVTAEIYDDGIDNPDTVSGVVHNDGATHELTGVTFGIEHAAGERITWYLTGAPGYPIALTARRDLGPVALGTPGGVMPSPGGHDWTREISISANVDDPSTNKVSLVRKIDQISLSPTYLGSRANIAAGVEAPPFYPIGSYALLDVGRRIVVETALARAMDDAEPADSDWVVAFDGVIHEINWQSDPIDVGLRDRPVAIAQDTLLEEEWVYAAGETGAPLKAWTWESGINLATERGGAIQYAVPTEANGIVYQLTTPGTTGASEPTWPTSGGVQDGSAYWTAVEGSQWAGISIVDVVNQLAGEAGLSVGGTPPTWNVLPYKQERQSVWDALRALVLQSGYDLQVKQVANGGGGQIQFVEPPRSTLTTPDWTFGPDQYRDLPTAKLEKQEVRNVIKVIYSARDEALRDSVNYPRETVTVQDDDSIAAYGRLFAELCEASTAQIDTLAEATALANAVLADLSQPHLVFEALVPYSPWLELGEGVQLDPDSVRLDTAVAGWVIALEHSLHDSIGTTKVTIHVVGGGGSPKQWQQRIARPGSARCRNRIPSRGVVAPTVNAIGEALKMTFAWPERGADARLFGGAASGFGVGRLSYLTGASRIHQTIGMSETDSQLHAVWGLSADDIWAAGDAGTIFHWDGASWGSVPSGTTKYIESIFGFAANDVWAVGDDGLALHWNGTSWSVFSSGTTDPIIAVWGAASNDVWAVGYLGAFVLHWNGSAWSKVAISYANPLLALFGFSASNVWAAGEDGVLRHWNGAAWSYPSSGTSDALNALFGVASNDLWAAGEAGTIIHWNGATWSASTSGTTNPIYALFGNATGDVWAAGLTGTVLHWSGAAWDAVSSWNPNTIFGVTGFSSGNVWAVGDFGTVLHWGGASWSIVMTPRDFFLLPKFRAPNTLPATSYYRIAIYDQWGQQIALGDEFSYP